MSKILHKALVKIGVKKQKRRESIEPDSITYMLSHLLRTGMPANETRLFAFHTPAQHFTTLEFRTLLEKGPKYIVNFFLRANRKKVDVLDFEKVASILHVHNLQFLTDSNETITVNNTLERAKYILRSDARLEPKALHGLLFNKELALTALANQSHLVKQHQFLAEEIAVLTDVSARDVIEYCSYPQKYHDGKGAFTEIDCIYMEALRKAA